MQLTPTSYIMGGLSTEMSHLLLPLYSEIDPLFLEIILYVSLICVTTAVFVLGDSELICRMVFQVEREELSKMKCHTN